MGAVVEGEIPMEENKEEDRNENETPPETETAQPHHHHRHHLQLQLEAQNKLVLQFMDSIHTYLSLFDALSSNLRQVSFLCFHFQLRYYFNSCYISF